MDRDGYMGGSGTERDLIYRDLARDIVAAGTAVVRYDNRGVRCNEMTMPPCPDGSSELEVTRHRGNQGRRLRQAGRCPVSRSDAGVSHGRGVERLVEAVV
jgi:hypothetical protein